MSIFKKKMKKRENRGEQMRIKSRKYAENN